MARRHGPFATLNPWRRIGWSVVAGLSVGTALVGLVLLPLVNRSGPEPLWAAICTALGIRSDPSPPEPGPPARYASTLRWTAATVADARLGDPRQGAFIALNCAACHGERGVNASGWIPNLAGMRPEAMVKELTDYRSGHRVWPVMQAVAGALSDEAIRDVAAHYASLTVPPERTKAPAPDEAARADIVRLVMVGDPARAIAPCGSCHGLDGLKRGAPVLAGQQAAYLAHQLVAFQMRTRRNDEGEQMRVLAARLTPAEIDGLAAYLGRREP